MQAIKPIILHGDRAGAALPHVWRFTGLRFITFLILVFLIFAMEIGWLDVVGADFYGNVVISLLFIISFFALAIGRGRGGLERLIGWISLVFGVVGIAVFLQDWFSVIPFLDILVGNIVFVYIGPGSWVRIAFIIIVLFYLLMRGHPSYNRPLAI